jgi:dihydrofolate reductase
MIISLVAAMAANRVIGKNNAIPWLLPSDQHRFRWLTQGHVVIMGRQTYESIGGPLPDRTNVVLTRQLGYSAPGCIVVHDLARALRLLGQAEDEAFIIGGADVYRQALRLAHRIYLTALHRQVCGDATFPEFSLDEFHEMSSETVAGPEPHSFSIYERPCPQVPTCLTDPTQSIH